MRANPWPGAHVATLRRRWAEGATATEIGMELHRTRSSVCGMAFRLKLSGKRERAWAPKRTPRPRVFKAFKYKKERLERPALVEPLNIPFLEARSGQCRAITDAARFAQRVCGHVTDERGVYCAAHTAIFYTPSKAKAR